jgi:hypothetical protein
VQLLVEEGIEVETVFIEADSASIPSLELVEFLAHNHPRLRRVLIGSGKAARRNRRGFGDQAGAKIHTARRLAESAR